MEPNSPSLGRSWAQDKSNRVARSAVFRENSKWWTKIHTWLTCVSEKEGHSTFLLAHYTFWFLFRTKLFSNAGYAAKLHKMLRNLTFVVQVAYFSIGPKKSFCSFSSNFWATFVTKSNFCFFLSTFSRNYGKLFEKSRAACGKPNHSWLTSSHNGTEICYRDFIHKVKIELLKEKALNRDLKIRRRRRQRERHKSNWFN